MKRYDHQVAEQSPTHWHPRLIEAAMALNDNRLDVAERILKPYLATDPFDVFAIRMLADRPVARQRKPASPSGRAGA